MILSELSGSSVVQVRLGPPGWSVQWEATGHLWGHGAGVRLGLGISSGGGTRSGCGFGGKWAEGGQEKGEEL